MIPSASNSISKEKNSTVIKRWKNVVNCSFQQIRKNQNKLTKIARNTEERSIQRDAYQFLKNTNKLQTIAQDLLNRLESLQTTMSKNDITIPSPTLIKQFSTEIALLQEMQFQATKKYVAFIHNNYDAPIIKLQTMVA